MCNVASDDMDLALQGYAKLPAAAQFKLPHQPYNYLEKV